MRSGSRTGLYDFRLGTDIHVLVGCGLGGGSLINAGVGLRPDARVFADQAWPEAVAQDGLLDLGFERAQAMLRPSRYGKAAELTKYRALETASAAFGQDPVAAPVVVSFEETVNPAGVTQPACTLCGDCCSGCNVGAKNTVAMTYLPDAKAHGAEIFTELSVSHVEKRGRELARPFRAVRGEGRCAQLRRCQDRGALGRHARLHRNPAPLPRPRAEALRPARDGLLRQWRHHRLRARRPREGQRRRRRRAAEIYRRHDRRLRRRADRASRCTATSTTA